MVQTTVRRWRAARAERDRARVELADAQIEAGERQRLSRGRRLLLGLGVAVVVALAGTGVWQATADRGYTDQQLVDAATQRVQLLLSADASDEDRAREILRGATGEFHDSFGQSAEAYTEYVQQRGSRGTAVVDGAALAARDGDRGAVLVSASLRVASGEEPADSDGAQQLRLRVVVEPEDGVLKLGRVTFLG